MVEPSGSVRHVFSILFGAAFTIAVMWAMGRLLFRRLSIHLHAVEHDLLAFITGGALLSLSIFMLCAVHAARTPVFLVLGLAALALNWRFGAASVGKLPALPALWKLLFAAPFLLYALLYLSNSLAPEASPDGVTYHLGLVYRYFREHGFRIVTTNMYSNLPLGTEMLFLFAFAFGRHSAAATVHCCYLLAMPLLMLSYARRIGRPRAGVCAAMIAYLSPVVGIDGISAYNDVALATTAFALFYLLEIRREDEETNDRLLIPIGLLAGFCVAIKLTGFVAPLYAAAVILIRKRPRALIPVSAAAALIFVPWLIKDWLWVGNPVSPFYNRIFRNPYIHIQFEDDYRAHFRHYDLTSFRPWFGAVTVGGQLGGQIGPLFLLAPLALLALRSRAGRHCLLAGLFFLIPYPQNIGARFLIPALPFVALGVALALEFSQTALALLIAAAAVLAWPRVIDKYRAPAGGWQIGHMPWKAALRIEPQDEFMRYRSVAWVGAVTLDYYVPRGKRVWSSTPVGEAYSVTDVMINYQSAEGERIEDILVTANTDGFAPTWNLRYTFPKHRVQHLRMVQTATGPDLWSIGEMRIFNGVEQIPRAPSWRFDATPFPWDIGLAFDGNPVTRWRSWESIHPGMHVDVDFGAPVEIDRVELYGSHDQWKIEVHPESCDNGVCAVIPAKLDKIDDPPIGDLRRLATQTVKARGIDYLFINDAYRTAADMRKDPARWGLEFIAQRADLGLYRIE
jgi:hypothetical protein